MRTYWSVVSLLSLMFCASPALPQHKVAEGEYRMLQTSSHVLSEAGTHWVLTSKGPDRYRLESEIPKQPSGLRVLQVEELDAQLVPVAIGYELYRGDRKTPDIVATCTFAGSAVTCRGRSGKDQAPPSPPYRFDGPFWLWVEGLFSLDLPWLFDGAVNMAHLNGGKMNVATLMVSGGSGVMIGDAINVAKLKGIMQPGQDLTVIAPNKPIPWDFNADEQSPLEFVAAESTDFNGTKVTAHHYTITDSDSGAVKHLWIASSGILLRISEEDNGPDFVLVNYKQYKNLIPELPVEIQPAGSKRPKPN